MPPSDLLLCCQVISIDCCFRFSSASEDPKIEADSSSLTRTGTHKQQGTHQLTDRLQVDSCLHRGEFSLFLRPGTELDTPRKYLLSTGRWAVPEMRCICCCFYSWMNNFVEVHSMLDRLRHPDMLHTVRSNKTASKRALWGGWLFLTLALWHPSMFVSFTYQLWVNSSSLNLVQQQHFQKLLKLCIHCIQYLSLM